MTDMEIPPAAVEAVARLMYARDGYAPWETEEPKEQETYRIEAGEFLAAALPHLQADTKASGTFERLLAEPNEQFDKRSDLLASIDAYSKAVSSTASAQPPRPTAVALYTEADTKAMCETATELGRRLGRQEAGEEIAAAFLDFETNDIRGRADMSIDRAVAIAREIGANPS